MGTPKLKGFSGNSITVLGSSIVKKTAKQDSVTRLKLQCQKQLNFKVKNSRFRISEVLNQEQKSNEFSFTMPYFPADSATQFTDCATYGRVLDFEQDLIALLEEFVQASSMENVPMETIRKKSLETIDVLANTSLLPSLHKLFSYHLAEIERFREGFLLPMGVSHGDLTFSNILFSRKERSYVLIDFLDSYIESPILDFAKIRQETKVCWSSVSTDLPHDDTKYRIVMQHLDRAIESHFEKHPFYRDYLSVFEFQNLLRVLKYVHNEMLQSILINRLSQLYSLSVKGKQ